MPPSSLSLLGLVRHMAEVERGWFGGVVALQADIPRLYGSDENPDGEFGDVATADADEAFATWDGECAHARQVEACVGSLDASFADRTRAYSLRGLDEAASRAVTPCPC